MKTKYYILSERIKEEMVYIYRSIEKAENAWEKAEISGDESYYDSSALNLHNMYNGIERIFEQIATIVDESMPEGKNWHRDLILQMGYDVKDVRPAVISESLLHTLDEFRSFRHIVRNIYTFNYNLEKMKNLIVQLPKLKEELYAKMEEFCQFLMH